MTIQQSQLEQLQTILMELPDEMRRTYSIQRSREGSRYALLSHATLNAAAPIFMLFRLNARRKWEEKNWQSLWERYYQTGIFPLLSLVLSSGPVLDGLQKEALDTVRGERKRKGLSGAYTNFWIKRIPRIGSAEDFEMVIAKKYQQRRSDLQQAEEILRKAPEAINRFVMGEVTFEQAKHDLKKQMDEGLKHYERCFGSLTLRGAARYLWAMVNHELARRLHVYLWEYFSWQS
jgi:hypothetical protein